MNQPSDEALRVANQIYRQIAQGDDNHHDDCMNSCATAIDDHTAALRAEVEALRGEREKAVELMRSVPAVLGQPRLGYVSSSEKIQEEATAYLRAYELIERALVILDK